ncbi:unnamed protein product [Cuscuta campestris]|uniref:Uncharacterized protein n=1 Tax=Cuscuta campestris TaxID=132261 RepID=A0A484KT81_9ASTE|nr:unnamed protein product [Cuscuta campestris]
MLLLLPQFEMEARQRTNVLDVQFEENRAWDWAKDLETEGNESHVEFVVENEACVTGQGLTQNGGSQLNTSPNHTEDPITLKT